MGVHPLQPGLFSAISNVVILLMAALGLAADEDAPRGYVSLDYQYIHVDGFESTVGELDIGTTDTHSLQLEVDVHLTDRWSVSAGLPLVTKRYNGPGPHDPTALDPPQDDKLVDDGDYHTSFQDFHFEARYRATEGVLTVEPFLSFGIPSYDYPYFGHAAVGQNLKRVGVGAYLTYIPWFSDFYLHIAPSYVFVEETLDTNIDHWLVHAEAGYFVDANLVLRAFMLAKHGNGLEFPDDFPPPRTDERWHQHDRMVKHNYVNMGVGFDYGFTPSMTYSLSAITMVHGDQVHRMRYAVNFGVTHAF